MGGSFRHRSVVLVVVAVAVAVAIAGTVSAGAQIVPLDPTQPQPTTTTTAPPAAPPDPAPDGTVVPAPAESQPPGSTPIQPGSLPEDEGEGVDDGGGRAIPAEARAVIDSIARSRPNDNHALVEGAAALEAAGVPHDEAVREVFGRFPVLGPTRWVDDWYFPRWTGTTFRYHLGLDMFADYGTPLAAPVDGVARISNNALGGLTIRVVEPDGTYWYLAHLSGVAEGLVDGAPVTVGQVIGFVGDSGNARGGAPHLHLGVYAAGGEPVPPKPYVDTFVADGAARVVELLPVAAATPQPAAVVASDLTRRLAEGVTSGPETSGPPRSELLWASAASPNGGALALADAAAASLNHSVDWERRGAEQRSLDLAWTQSVDRAWQVMGPLVNPILRRAIEQRQPH